jgi:hypothetical protein
LRHYIISPFKVIYYCFILSIAKDFKAGIETRIYQNQEYTDATYHDISYESTRRLMESNNIPYEIEHLQASQVRRSPKHTEAYLWLKDHFASTGDTSPNGDKVYLDLIDKQEIHAMYANDMEVLGLPVLNLNTWLKLWVDAFPFVVIRSYKQVTGKVMIQ